MTLYDWQYIQESWDVDAGNAAREHSEKSGHNDRYMLTYGRTVTCLHPACEPRWGYGYSGRENA